VYRGSDSSICRERRDHIVQRVGFGDHAFWQVRAKRLVEPHEKLDALETAQA
jgi:hypothetical protein